MKVIHDLGRLYWNENVKIIFIDKAFDLTMMTFDNGMCLRRGLREYVQFTCDRLQQSLTLMFSKDGHTM